MRAGIECFHLVCHFDDKMSEIEGEYGLKGTALITRLWCKIYAGNGYYCEWNEKKALLFLSNWFGGNSGVSINLINTVVEKALDVGVFSRKMYKKYGILTSEGIQKEYFKNVKRRKILEIEKAYVLVDVHKICPNVNIIYKNVCKKSKNADILKQSREEESREEESRADVYGEQAAKPPRARTVFKKPTVEEIAEYCRERGNTVDPERFFDYYESNGWKAGRNPMRDWRAAVRNWERNGYNPSGSKGGAAKSNVWYDMANSIGE